MKFTEKGCNQVTSHSQFSKILFQSNIGTYLKLGKSSKTTEQFLQKPISS